MSVMDKLYDFVKSIQENFDNWVASNVSRETQNIIIVSVFFLLVVHLVYTKRKLTREAKERLQEEEQKAKNKKKVK